MQDIVKAGAILMPDAVAVERLEMLERREVKQHHDEQHLGQGQLACALPCRLRRDAPMLFPRLEHHAEIVETAIERCDIDGH